MTVPPILTYILRAADNALVLGHRISEWTGLAPTLEEDIALSNLALDLIGQARMLYDYASRVEGEGRTEDAFAFLRGDHEFSNVLLVEQPNGDFAATMVRHLFFAAFAQPFYNALTHSKDSTLAAIAAKAEKEMAYHFRHAGEWVIRLGDGTEESHGRAQDALDELAIYVDELFEVDQSDRALIEAGIAVDPAQIRQSFDAAINNILKEATLIIPEVRHAHTGGRTGRHTEHLGHMLAQMQALHRAHPGAVW